MQEQKIKSKVRKGDTVMINAGRERGKSGKVLRVIDKGNRVIVEKLNMIKKHSKPTQTNPAGGIVDREAPLSASNVQIFCTKCNKGVRTGLKQVENKKVRFCRTCGQNI
ncbi:MAG: 50S ribosomal protein L24 [Oligoflexia bacterium]|nr:50S ribosomal protein L24 [Oligoflexia bacterium]